MSNYLFLLYLPYLRQFALLQYFYYTVVNLVYRFSNNNSSMDLSRLICPNCQAKLMHDDTQLWLKCQCCGYQIYAKQNITKDEILMGRDKDYPLDEELSSNLEKLLYAINMFRTIYNKPMSVTSGYRPGAFNSAAGGAKRSNHMVCLAVDISDPDGQIRAFTLNHLDALSHLGLYCEDFRWTKGWVHYQVVPPASGKRIFVPNANPASCPECWDGIYDSAYDDKKS